MVLNTYSGRKNFISKIYIPDAMPENKIVLSGIVTHGLGDGTFFMSMHQYRKEIQEKLGFDAYPGTLNLKIETSQREKLNSISPIRLQGFQSGKKEFGGVSCYKAKIKNADGALIIPDFNKHKEDVIEFISALHARSELRLKDGDKITVELLN